MALRQKTITMIVAVLVCALVAAGTSVYMARANGVSWDTQADTSWYDPIYPTYKINTPQQLAGVAQLVNQNASVNGHPPVDGFRGKILEITTDLDLSGYIWEPIGTEEHPFRGALIALDGGTFSIRGMALPQEVRYGGLVGNMDNGTVGGYVFESNGTIQLQNSQAVYVGAAVGKMTGSSIVYNITNHIAIQATSDSEVHAGGIVGSGEGDISTSVNYASVSANGRNLYTGGLVGTTGTYGMKMKKNANHGVITATGNSQGDVYAAGIVGYAHGTLRMEEENTPFDNSGAILVQSGINHYAGGIVGRADSELNLSELTSSTALVESAAADSSSSYVGGLAGAITAQQQDRNYRVNFLHTAPVINNGGSQVYTGGIVGYVGSDLTWHNAHTNTTEITVSGDDHVYTGGLIGHITGELALEAAAGNSAAIRVSGEPDEAYTGGLLGYGGNRMLLNNAQPNAYNNNGVITVDGGTGVYTGGIVSNRAYARTSNEPSNNVHSNAELIVTGQQKVYTGGYIGLLPAASADKRVSGATFAQSITVTSTASTADDTVSTGGIVGYADEAHIEQSVFSGKLQVTGGAETYTGGIIGRLQSGSVTASQAVGTADTFAVLKSDGVLGGIAGYANGTLDDVSSRHLAITATTRDAAAGGIAGSAQGTITGAVVGDAGFSNPNSLTINAEVPAGEGAHRLTAGGIIGHNETAVAIVQSQVTKVGFLTQADTSDYTIGGIAGKLTAEASVGTAEDSVAVSNVTTNLQADNSSFGGAIGVNQAPVLFVDVRNIQLTSPADHVRAGGIVGIQEGSISSDNSQMESHQVNITLEGASAYAGGSFGQITGNSPRTLAEFITITASGADNRLGGTAGDVSGTLTDSVASSVVIQASGARTEAGGIAGRIETAGESNAVITGAHAVAGEQPMITITGEQSMIGGIVGHAVKANIIQPAADGELPNYVILNVRAAQVQAGGLAGHMEEGMIIGDSFKTNLGNVLINTSEAATDAYIGGVTGYNDRAKLKGLDGRIVNLVVSGPRTTVGGMAGYNKGTNEAVISNVALIGLNVQVNPAAASSIVGGYVGLNDVRSGDPVTAPQTAVSSIQHSRVVGTANRAVHVTAPNTVTGGMVGENRTLIANNSITDKIPVHSGDSQGLVGGLVGRNTETATLYYTYSNATMSIQGAGTIAGGLVGHNEGRIQASYVDIDITGSATGSQSASVYLGGLVGRNTGNIQQSHTSSVVTATGAYTNVGGLVGDHQSGTITDSYVVKTVRVQAEHSYAGGFAGRIGNGEIARTYSTARVLAENGAYAGGFAGRYDNVSKELLYKNFYVKDEVKQFNNDLPDFAAGRYNFLSVLGGLSTLLTETLEDRQAFPTLSGWDFEATWKYASPNAAYQYPELNRTANTGGQDGNNVNANINWYMNDRGAEKYVLTTEAELAGLAALVNGTVPGMDAFDFRNRIIELGGKVSIQSQQWVPIGFNEERPFQGTFNGGHHLIDGLTVEPVHGYSGLFGVIGEQGAVTRMTMEPQAVAGLNYTGVLAGFNKGTVSDVNIDLLDGMEVSGKTVGSVIGKNTGTWSDLQITIKDGSRIVGAYADSIVGGVIGENEADLKPELFDLRSEDGSVGSDADTAVIGGIVGKQTGDMSGFQVALKPEFRIFAGGRNQIVGGLVGHYVSGQATDLNVSFQGGILLASGEGTVIGGVIGQSDAGNTLQNVSVSGETQEAHLSGKGILGGVIGVKNGQDSTSFDIQNVVVDKLRLSAQADSTNAVLGGAVGQMTATAVSGVKTNVTLVSDAARVTAGGVVGDAHNSIIYDAESLPHLTVNARSGKSAIGGIAGVLSSDARDQAFDFGHWAPLYHGLYDVRVLPTTVRVNGKDNEANLVVGGLAGQLLEASIYNSDSQASFLVQGGRVTELGGIAGYSSGIIVRTYAHGSIDVPSSRVFQVGGVVGHAVGGELHYTRWQGEDNSKLTVGTAVSKPGLLPATYAGGFVGSAEETLMTHVSSDMNVVVSDENQDNTIIAGGFAGMLGIGQPVAGEIHTAYATGDVQVNGRLGAYVGGFVGSANHYVITDSYASGNILNTGFDTRSGGFAGAVEVGAEIQTSYALQESVKTSGTRGATRSYNGGFAGYNDGVLRQVHAGPIAITVEVRGANVYSGSLIGYNYRDGKLLQSTVDHPADVIGYNLGSAPTVSRQTVQPLGVSSIWTDRADTSFLSDPEQGVITVRTPEQLYGTVLLNNEQGLAYYRLFDRTATEKLPLDLIQLASNLDLTGQYWQSFDTNRGIIDGQGHTITGLKLEGNSDEPTGFVQENAGTIRNLRFASATMQTSTDGGIVAGVNTGTIDQVQADVQITSTASHTGGIAGRNEGTITRSLTTGRITTEDASNSATGGIAGDNTAQGSISEVLSYAAVQASGDTTAAGGIAGRNSGQIAYASATGTVATDGMTKSWAGGIAGYAADGSISQSIAGGEITAVSEGKLIPGITYFGGIAGQKQDEAALSANIFNKQMLKLSSAFYSEAGSRVASNADNLALTGKQLTSSTLPGTLNADHWQAVASFYPRLKALSDQPENLLGAAAVVLHEQDLATRIDRERSAALSATGIVWSVPRQQATISANKATLVATQQPIAFTAAAGGKERIIQIQSAAPRYESKAVKPDVPAQTTLTNPVQVTLTTTETGGQIYYTLDGKTPNETSQLYSGPFELKETTTVKAITIAENKEYSDVATGVWTKQQSGGGPVPGGGGGGGVVIPPTPKPEPEPEPEAKPAVQASIGGQVADSEGTQSVKVAQNSKLTLTAPAGQTIYYTTDGSKPTTRSKVYKGELMITGNMTIKTITSADDTVITFRFEVEKAAYDVKENAADIRYMPVYADKSFRPSQAISRYELIEALAPLLDMQQITVGVPFSDVKSREEDLVGFFASAGIIEGYPNGTFGSDRGLTRAEFVVVLSRVLQLETNATQSTLLSDIRGHWSEAYVNAFTAQGLIQGFPDGTFRPQELVTRAQAVTVINRMVGTRIDANHTPVSDVKPGHWAYDAIMSAIK
ncbi:chitobiase/beta-hexosaminidase C-terminal domain-containing protein [Paenibacillus daejeonensis]|uniref:chitobiase/beta-hexosaminidase C-terminal domain-containing protein n=1 Tax=Paenibacillus daejeonensis TaxID=135193 RepID=UPI00037984A9|nr:FN3 associated domain-containing protein [Paenibacillus daejeonensis]